MRSRVPDVAQQSAIHQSGVIALSLADQKTFAGALLARSKPNAALKRAFARLRKLIAAA